MPKDDYSDLEIFLKVLIRTMLIVTPCVILIAYLNMVVRMGLPFTFNVVLGPIIIGTLISITASFLNLRFYHQLLSIKKQHINNLEKLVHTRTAELEVANKKLKNLSITDPLTGLGNRRALSMCLNKEIAHSKRNKSPFSLIMIDIDYFKLYNDNYGHDKGDETLALVAQQIKSSLPRQGDNAIRFGGEEFIVVLSDTNYDGATQVAERIRNVIINCNIQHEYSEIENYLTVSLGVTTSESESTQEKDLLKRVDKALYQAKGLGRNQVQ